MIVMRVLATILIVVFLALYPGAPANAESGEQLGNESALARAESYLRGLDTLQARFVQATSDGGRLEGVFYLDRPGRLRFEYDDRDDFIVADGMFIYFYDAAFGEQSNAPIGQTLADFLLREDLRLSGDIQVQSVREEGGLTYITLAQQADPGAGSLRLAFQTEPYALRMWRVVDAQGFITDIYLQDVQTGLDLPRRLFAYHDPSRAVRELNQ
jgi:outer membrane lipoprotein-sorting protein